MGFPFATTVSAVSAAASALAAFAAYHAARKANSTAVAVANIERDRRHSELRPVLEIGTPQSATDPDILRFRFTGPDELESFGLLTVTVTIRDDRDRSNDSLLGGSPTREELAAQIWGPWRLRPRVDGADQQGRSAPGRTVRVGEELVSSIDKTLSPQWSRDQPGWDRQYSGAPIRLRVEITAEGFRPWVLLREVPPWRGRGVRFEIQRGTGDLYLLRNVGTSTAIDVTVEDGPGVDDRPQNVTVAVGEAVHMIMAGSLAVSLPTELRVVWDGQLEPVTLPMPPR
ncbi:hypothetical protein ACEZCY_24695 [Streptacidiphilus sp. N1-12]|uniref:Secreted protein n=2 Tax=Streptacidiphilus alkalitolerans TaxID=3342712 RepID=A0ABV6WKV6_9ACTN